MSRFYDVENNGRWDVGNIYRFYFDCGMDEAYPCLDTGTDDDPLYEPEWPEYGLALFANNKSDFTGGIPETRFSAYSIGPGDDWFDTVVPENLQGGIYYLKSKTVPGSGTWEKYPVYILNVDNPPDFAPPGPSTTGEGEEETITGENTIITLKRLVVAANDKIWYEVLD